MLSIFACTIGISCAFIKKNPQPSSQIKASFKEWMATSRDKEGAQPHWALLWFPHQTNLNKNESTFSLPCYTKKHHPKRQQMQRHSPCVAVSMSGIHSISTLRLCFQHCETTLELSRAAYQSLLIQALKRRSKFLFPVSFELLAFPHLLPCSL